MRMALFHTIIDTFALDKGLKVIDRGSKEDMEKKHGNEEIGEENITAALKSLRETVDLKEFYAANMEITKKGIKESVSDDSFIVQAINNIDDVTKVSNILTKRLREWYELYNPEFSESIANNDKFVDLIIKKKKSELLKEIKSDGAMGAELSAEDLAPIIALANEVLSLRKLKDIQEDYIEGKMKDLAPNVTAIAGAIIGAKLLEHVGTLKRLMMLPSSTIQLLGAEKALFRHLVTGAKCPKFGVIFNHPLVAISKNKGKAARLIADKISIAAKVDYFKGEFIGDKLRKELEKKIS